MTVCLGEVAVRVPEWVRDFDSFVTWMHSDEFPQGGGSITSTVKSGST